MAAEIAVGGAYVPSTPHVKVVEQTLAVARRAVVRTARQRGLIIFPMIFPLILFAINGSALSTATRIPGFPTHNYRDFLIAMPFVQERCSSRSMPVSTLPATSRAAFSTACR